MSVSASSRITRWSKADLAEVTNRSTTAGSATDAIPRHDRRKRTRIVSGTGSKSRQFVTGVLAVWLGWPSQVTARAQETLQSNWVSADAPCAKYDDLRKPVLGDIGVKIDATQPWANGFRRALNFWNTVLDANFHEEADLGSCAVRIISAGPDILNKTIVARSQLTEWDNFRSMIAVSPKAAKAMTSAEMYGAAVHELGHMLGLKHNASSQSVMYFFNVNGTESLDRKDILDLSTRHKLRAAAVPTGFRPIKVVLIVVPIPMH
jgi:Matrixin